MDCICEMCLRRKATERHHIIPKVASIPNFDIDRDDNVIYLCSVCHSRLTPTSALTSYKLRRIQHENETLFDAENKVCEYVQEVFSRIDNEMPCKLQASEVIDIMHGVLNDWDIMH